jgi:hypothetical protein
LTFKVSSNQVALQLTVVTVNNVPIPVTDESRDRPFDVMVQGAKADLQIADSFSLTQLTPV